MKTTFSRSSLTVVALVFGLLFAALSVSAQVTVEQIQRDFQARYYLMMSNYLKWPDCISGSPAPNFPKDGFYGDLSENPDKAVEVVSNLVQQFYFSNIVYSSFVKAPNGEADIEGSTVITNYISADMNVFQGSDVNANNYAAILGSLAADMRKLRLVQIPATQTITNDDTKETYCRSIDETSCSDVMDCVGNNHVSTPWGSYDGYFYHPNTSICEGPYESSSDAFANIGIVCETTAEDPYPQICYIRNTRGKITANLTPFAKGTARVYLKLSAVACNHNYLNSGNPTYCGGTTFTSFSHTLPTSAGENKYGRWSQGILIMGTNSISDYVTDASTLPGPIGDCSFPDEQIYGWEVADAVAIVAPDFTAKPEDRDCCACTSQCPAGQGTFKDSSIHIDIPFGSDNFSGSAGSISLAADFPSLSLATPAALAYTMAANVEFITNSTPPLTHLQFKTSQNLANIQTNNSFKYTASFYTSADAGAKDGSGFYQPTGSPYTTVVIENPDASTNIYNHLKITTTTDGNATITDFIYDSTNNIWEMDTGNGLRKEIRASVWDAGQTNRTETVTIKNSADQVVYKEINFWRLFPWGQERLTNVVDPDGAKLTNTWIYYSGTNDGGNYRQLQQSTDANGHWIDYQYDQNGRETNRVTQFLNSPVGSSGSSNRVTTTIYSTNAPQITSIDTLLGVEVNRLYQIVTSGEVDDIHCQTRGAAINASDNLTNITKRYTSGSFAGQTKGIQNADGTIQISLYSTNATFKTTVTLAGVPDPGSDTNITSGTITTTTTALGGQVLTNVVYYRQPGASDTLIDRDLYTYTDTRNRSYYVVHIDGNTNFYNYACCGLDSTVDRDGTITDYSYDSLKRQVASTRNSITTTNILDPNGAVLVTIRIGSDNSQIVQQQQLYDLAGRLVRETNALGGVTLHTNYFDGSHLLVSQTTYPDGGTRVELYNQDGSLQKVAGTASKPARYEYGIESDGNGVTNAYTKQIKLDAGGSDTSEWAKSYSDAIGRNYKTAFAAASAPYPATVSFFSNRGQLTNQVDPDGISTLFAWNEKGEPAYSVLDSNRNYTIDFSGNDRLAFVTNDVVTDNGTTVRRSRTYAWNTSANTSNLISTTESSVDGLQSWKTIWNNGQPITSHSQVFCDSVHGYRITTNIAPDGSYTISSNQFGLPLSVTLRDSVGAQIGQTIYGVDAHGRQNMSADARNGTTTSYFNSADQVSGVVSPPPAVGQSGQVTTNFFDTMGRTIATKLPDGTYVTNKFDLTGLITNTFGSRTYPVGYTYDAQGRVKTMTTWKNFAANSGAATTTWNYDIYRGWITNKTYDGNISGPRYTYTAAGRMGSRLWARGSSTTYSYNGAGDLSAIIYADGLTPNVTLDYDRRGRQIFVSNSTDVCSVTLNDAGDLLSEANSGGPLNGLSVNYGYDQFLRRTNLSLLSGMSLISATRYSYDAASRLSSVSDGTNSATYSYLPNSPLVSQIAFTNGSAQRLVTTKVYDYLNHLTELSNTNSQAGTISSFDYQYNLANQRTVITNADTGRWVYSYDSLGQVVSGKKYWNDGTPVAGQQFEYGFDDIGNRQTTGVGGDQWSANLRYASYSVNGLNQYTSRTVPGFINDIGTATSNATVTLWRDDGSFVPTYRHKDYYRAEMAVNNSTGALWLTLTNLGVVLNGTNTDIATNFVGNLFLPATAETFGYDPDGNMTNDGRWIFTWDSENRLIKMESQAADPLGSKLRLEFSYDAFGRRIQKVLSLWNGTNYVAQSTNNFIYNVWNPLAVLSSSAQPVTLFIWGSDSSGAYNAAGGVGGLLVTKEIASGSTACFVAYDGNDNISALVQSTDGSIAANYEYGPFGEVSRATGPLAKVNKMLFSTKLCDWESGLYYYGFRYYNPLIGRWLSRDPVEEQGGLNVCSLAGNDGVNAIDPLGLTLLTHGTSVANATMSGGILEAGLQPGSQLGGGLPNIWMSGEGAGVPDNEVNLTYDMNVESAKEVPCSIIQEAINKGRSEAAGLPSSEAGTVKGRAIWGHINDYIQKEPGGIWKVPSDAYGRAVADTTKMTGYQYAFKSSALWKSTKPVLMRIKGAGAPFVFSKLGFANDELLAAERAAQIRFGANAARVLKVGGRVLVAVGVAVSVYDVYTADNKMREVVRQTGGWTGAAIGWNYGSRGGLIVGAAIPGAGETGVSEAIGYFGGGIIFAAGGWIFGMHSTTVVYDWIFTPGAPQ